MIPLALALFGFPVSPARAQTTGSVLGRVVNAGDETPVAGATVRILGLELRTLSTVGGRFVLVGVPAGERTLRVEHLGFRPVELVITVRASAATPPVLIRLEAAPIALPGVSVEAQRFRLVEPEVRLSHEVVGGTELRQLPLDAAEEALDLAPGVSEGHFRGGRIGQESYVVDGLELKNQLEGSTEGLGLELSPYALEEVDVITGGFGAAQGSALSGAVRYVTRRGGLDRWRGRLGLLSDEWVPRSLASGFTALSASAGGPLPVLGKGTTVFADVLAQGLLDAEPRARGLTCLQPGDAGRERTAELIAQASRAGFHCPFSGSGVPNQVGDRVIGFLRLDRPLGDGLALSASLLANRRQQELYTPELKYNPDYQLAHRLGGGLANVSLDWTRHRSGRGLHVTARVAALRLDRRVGAVDVHRVLAGRTDGFSLSSFPFLGESDTRRPIAEQLASPHPTPGYIVPSGAVGTPFGAAGEGLFLSRGTPGLASWSRSEFVSGQLDGEVIDARGHSLRAGAVVKLYRIEWYERLAAYYASSVPYYARFYPTTASGYAEGRLALGDEITAEVGLRFDAFRSGLRFRTDPLLDTSPVLDASWKLGLSPRFGVVMPVPGLARTTVLRASYAFLDEPPDFRYFLDTSVGDSLRTDIQRQGNPQLGFERGISYELGVTHLLTPELAVGVTGFRKELRNLVTGSLRLSEVGDGVFSLDDFGTVQGAELTVRGSWPGARLRFSWTVQKAVGVGSNALDASVTVPVAPVEYPLAFDRRHSLDLSLVVGAAAGAAESPWTGAITGRLESGYPLNRQLAGGAAVDSVVRAYLPWTAELDLRAGRDIGAPPGCARCRLALQVDARNLLGRTNVLALRPETGTLAPAADEVLALAARVPPPAEPIPRESPLYAAAADPNRDGLITPEEFAAARLAAVLDRYDPTLFFGEPRQVRLGLEVRF